VNHRGAASHHRTVQDRHQRGQQLARAVDPVLVRGADDLNPLTDEADGVRGVGQLVLENRGFRHRLQWRRDEDVAGYVVLGGEAREHRPELRRGRCAGRYPDTHPAVDVEVQPALRASHDDLPFALVEDAVRMRIRRLRWRAPGGHRQAC
jgi:hypothetical protein